MYDVAVIGAGVVGGCVARELARFSLKTVVLERGADAVQGASKANSGIVHAGFDAKEGTLKAKFNVLGNKMMEDYCKELGVKFRNNGSLVVAFAEEDIPKLYELKERGEKNGVSDLEVIDKEELFKLEPHINKNAVGALYAKTGGIVCPYNLAIAALGNAMDNGVDFITDFEVVKREGNAVYSANGDKIEAKYFINCAGAGSEKVANAFGDFSFKVGYRKGEYMLLDKTSGYFADRTLFSLPTKAGKGVLISPTVDGNLLVGPTSIEEDEFDNGIRRDAFNELKEKASMLGDNPPYYDVITSFAGVRVYSDRHDFVIEESKVAPLFNVAGIESPGLTSAPAIGVYVAGFVAEKLGAKEKPDFNPIRRPENFFKNMTVKEKNDYIAKHPEYGKIVCRCESVTLGEILDAIRENPKAKTIDGVKLRTRAGMGRCQSGFCQPTVLETLEKECGLKFNEVTKNGKKSYIIVGGEK